MSVTSKLTEKLIAELESAGFSLGGFKQFINDVVNDKGEYYLIDNSKGWANCAIGLYINSLGITPNYNQVYMDYICIEFFGDIIANYVLLGEDGQTYNELLQVIYEYEEYPI